MLPGVVVLLRGALEAGAPGALGGGGFAPGAPGGGGFNAAGTGVGSTTFSLSNLINASSESLRDLPWLISKTASFLCVTQR